jgi:hypothetical protein
MRDELLQMRPVDRRRARIGMLQSRDVELELRAVTFALHDLPLQLPGVSFERGAALFELHDSSRDLR